MTYLCLSSFSTFPLFLSIVSPLIMYFQSNSRSITSLGYPKTLTSFSVVSLYARASKVSGLYCASV